MPAQTNAPTKQNVQSPMKKIYCLKIGSYREKKELTWSASTNRIFFTSSGNKTSKNKILYLEQKKNKQNKALDKYSVVYIG